jgi:hypothetical protein
MADTNVYGKAASNLLRNGLSAVRLGPMAEWARRHVVDGVTQRGTLCGGRSVSEFIAESGQVLIESKRVFRQGNVLSLQVEVAGEKQLIPLSVGLMAEPKAPALLANLIVAGMRSEDSSQESVLPNNLTAALLADQSLWSKAPAISFVTRRPAFDDEFDLCKPGWNQGSGVLSFAPDVATGMVLPRVDAAGGPSARLPSHIQLLFEEFPWAAEADRVTAVAVLLSGVLINHFVKKPHPPLLVEGNQPGLGKTLLAQTIGLVLDAVVPPPIPLTGDDELAKRLSAQLLYGQSSIMLLDNVRERIASALLEQNMLSPTICLRILGASRIVSRANTYQWITTSNQTAATEDVVDRFVIARLHYEGDPRQRSFKRDPLEYAAEHRLEILGELVAMVQRWLLSGKPLGRHRHRCRHWAEVIGGILDANGLGEWFLAGQAEAAAQLDEGLQALTALAEHVLSEPSAKFVCRPGDDAAQKGGPAADWAPLFERCQLYRDVLSAKSTHARATWVGTFLGAKVDRQVAITNEQFASATLRRRDGRSGRKYYYFDLGNADSYEPAAAAMAQTPNGARQQTQIDTQVAAEVTEPSADSRDCPAEGSLIVVRPACENGNDLDW